MMKKKLLSIMMMVAASSAANADRAFDGFDFQLGLGLAGTQMSVGGTRDATVSPIASINGNTSGQSVVGQTSFGYSQSIKTWNLNFAGNVFYTIGNQFAGRRDNSGLYNDGTVSELLYGTFKLKNTWGFAFEPGYYFLEKALGYLKLAYVRSTLQSNLFCTASDGACFQSGIPLSSNVQGFGYGLGVKQMITEHAFAAIDLMGVSYQSINQTYDWLPNLAGNPNNRATFMPTQYMGFISVGYKF